MEAALYWLWLQEVFGPGSLKAEQIVTELDSPRRLYEMSEEERQETGLFGAKELERLKRVPLDGAYKALEKAQELGCHVLTPEHEEYPARLAHIGCLPCVLYVLGDVSSLDEHLLITMVGTRKSTEYGAQAAARLGADLAAAGCIVVSGLAEGIDAASHGGALQMGGRCIGFMACGLDVDYPKKNHDLKQRILENKGAIISEFPFGARAMPHHFNIRNRLLSGISAGTVVVQAPKWSGALNTASHAANQGREVFAVPGSIFDRSMVGCNLLIRDGGKIVINAYSVLEEFLHCLPPSMSPSSIVRGIQRASGEKTVCNAGKPKEKKASRLAPVERKSALVHKTQEELEQLGVSGAAVIIYHIIGEEPVGCEEIAGRSTLPMADVLAVLTELEIWGLIRALPGKRFCLSP